ncbi:MAG: hypothetical protein GY858_01870 [Candidatus Omnitrophica bacterium]|nr:hypothetical protein [Candidatus Omnitrophota bacterium]
MKDEMNILREVGTTAAAHGGTALSEMLKRKIALAVPSVKTIRTKDLDKAITIDENTLVLQSRILTGLSGKIICALEEKTAYKFVTIYQKMDPAILDAASTEMAMSLMKEIGNILISAYAGALGYFMKRVIIPSMPILLNAPFIEIMKLITSDYHPDKEVMVIESSFEETKENIKGNFWLVLTPEAVDEIKNACKKILTEL